MNHQHQEGWIELEAAQSVAGACMVPMVIVVLALTQRQRGIPSVGSSGVVRGELTAPEPVYQGVLRAEEID